MLLSKPSISANPDHIMACKCERVLLGTCHGDAAQKVVEW
jgi:hypothetical protein